MNTAGKRGKIAAATMMVATAILAATLLTAPGAAWAEPSPAEQAQTAVGPKISLDIGDVSLPPDYVIEPVLTGLTYASSMTFGDDGALYIAEAGHCYGQYWTDGPRIFRFQPSTGRVTTVTSGFRAPVMGITFHDGRLYVAHRGTISTIELRAGPERGRVRDIVTGLPVVPNGQHFNGPVAFDPRDGKMYFAVGSFTNSGVPDASDAIYGWLLDFPGLREVPAQPITLSGETYPSPDVLAPTSEILKIVRGSAYQPFATSARPGQSVPAHPTPTTAVFRANLDGTNREVIAWGLRSPVGFAFGPDGRLYLTDHGMDDKGARAAYEANDALWVIRPNAWYGWPDYVAGIPITDARFNDPKFPITRRPVPVIQNPPPVEQPVARFEPHASAMKFDWSRSERFGYAGQMFLAEFGDGQPITTGLQTGPRRGFRVVRVNTENGAIEPFLTITNPGTEGTRGPKRPYAVQFDPGGDNLYLLDFGVLAIRVSAQRVGIDAPVQTGTLWRIRRQTSGETQTAPAIARIATGSRLISWWSVRGLGLILRRDLHAAVLQVERARKLGPFDLRSNRHREQAQELLEGVATLAAFGLQRIDDPNVLDDGTHLLLLRVRDLAQSHSAQPLTLAANDPVITDLDRWAERTRFPETDYLTTNYSAPGRWQRPLADDVRR